MARRGGKSLAVLLLAGLMLTVCSGTISPRLWLITLAAAQDNKGQEAADAPLDLQNEKTRKEIEKIGEEVKQLKELVNRKTEREIEKIGAEAKKIKQEEQQLSWQNSLIGRIATYLGAAGVGAVLATFLSFMIGRHSDRVSEQQNEARNDMMRQESNLALYRDLASTNAQQQIAAAAVLVGRLLQSSESPKETEKRKWERRTIADVLVAVIKNKKAPGHDPAAQEVAAQRSYRIHLRNSQPQEPSAGLAKYIGDQIVIALNAVVPDKQLEPSGQLSPLEVTDWQKVQLVEPWWERVDARGIDFFGAKFKKAGLAEAFLQGAIFYDAELPEATLKNAILKGANLVRTDLSGAKLQGADLSKGTPSKRASPTGVTILKGATLEKAILTDAKLTEADLAGANLTEADLTLADLSNAILKPADPSNDPQPLASPTGVTILRGAILAHAILKGANLTRADLSHANLKGANLKGADLTGAILDDIQFDETTLWPDGFEPPDVPTE